MMVSNDIKPALQQAWHPETASNSLQRWLELARQEAWQFSDETVPLMTRLFGASWYFTRYVFFRGADVLPLFEADRQTVNKVEHSIAGLRDFAPADELTASIAQLRNKKNELMLSVLLLQLGKVIDQIEAERLLTRIAENVLVIMYRLYGLDQLEETRCIVLAMGRFAGDEMNYGSDLDLIFIEQVIDSAGFEQVFTRIRKMLRQIAALDPCGALYEIDMRLRPHGSSGTLVTPLDSFIEFHKGRREIWERQMMTRCRVVCGDPGLVARVSKEIIEDVYREYDPVFLASEIMKVRLLVEQELAGDRGSIELKRGKGGIMDIDFISHFLQLAHGHDDPAFRQTSSRRVIEIAREKGLLTQQAASLLLEAYNFYKTSETALRVFDMKSSSKLANTDTALLPLARANGYLDDAQQAVTAYREQLFTYRDNVRFLFEQLLTDAQ